MERSRSANREKLYKKHECKNFKKLHFLCQPMICHCLPNIELVNQVSPNNVYNIKILNKIVNKFNVTYWNIQKLDDPGFESGSRST